MQQHNRFKLFVGQHSSTDPLSGIADEVTRFVADKAVAAKSIGTEYIESRRSLLVTLGYRDDEESYPVRLQAVKLAGAASDMQDLGLLETQMSEAG